MKTTTEPRSARIHRKDFNTMAEPTTRRRGDRYVTRKEDIMPLTPEEIEEQREVFARMKEHREELMKRRGGVLFPNSWELINEERDKRSAQR